MLEQDLDLLAEWRSLQTEALAKHSACSVKRQNIDVARCIIPVNLLVRYENKAIV
jgi:hypothetical protein